MLEVARQVSACYDQIEFVEGSALELPVPDSHFDAVLCQQAIMFFPDREEAAREMYRALKPGGRVGLNVWRRPEHNPTFSCLITALEKHASHEAADFMRSPFVMKSVSEMRSIFEQAGFADVRVLIRVDTLRYPSVAHLVRFETLNIPDPQIQTDAVQEDLTREMNQLVSEYIDDEGVVFPLQDYVVFARR
jgi:SAM-dependent methyltransferase